MTTVFGDIFSVFPDLISKSKSGEPFPIMPIVRRVRPTDLLSLNLCNLDSYTENYDLNFYLTYLMKWPSLFQCVEEDGGKIVAYSS